MKRKMARRIKMNLNFENYTGKYKKLNGNCDMNIRIMDLCRHTMQVGYKNRGAYWKTSWFKHLELFFMVLANVTEESGELKLKKGYFQLDQSEKVCVSYQLGQGLTKAVAEQFLEIPWVCHFKTMKNMGVCFELGGSKKKIIVAGMDKGKEPDLVGFDLHDCAHLLESKGSSEDNSSNKVIQKAINQVSKFDKLDVAGKCKPFVTRSACIFNFTDSFHGRIIDPPPENNEKSIEGNASLLLCLYAYYYDFFSDINKEMELQLISRFEREWSGIVFSYGEKKYFWGLNTSYKNFLEKEIFSKYKLDNEQDIANLEKLRGYQNTEEKILEFFQSQEVSMHMSENASASIGKDGFILCQLENDIV